MITIDDKQYDPEDFTKEQRQIYRNIQVVEQMLNTKKAEVAVFEKAKRDLADELKALLDPPQPEELMGQV